MNMLWIDKCGTNVEGTKWDMWENIKVTGEEMILWNP